MRHSVSTWSLLALAHFGAVQACDSSSPCQKSADAVPTCAKPCIESAAVTNAHCATTDFACQCSSSAAIQNAAFNCVISGCGPETGVQVLGSVSALCACVTASPTTPCTSLPATTTPAPGTTTTSVGVPTTSNPPPATTTQSTGPITTGPITTGPVTKGPVTEGPASCDASSPCQKSADAVPKCATSCISSAAMGVNCANTDFECQCKSSSAIQNAAFNCVSSGCGLATGVQVLQSVSALCSCVSASPTTPCSSQATPTGSSAPGTTPDGTATSTTALWIKPPTGTELQNVTATQSVPCTTPTGVSSEHGGEKTQTVGKGERQTCVPGTKANCGPVASSAVPSCAQKCFSSAAPSVGCSVDDYACQCQDKAQSSLSQILVPCVATACPPDAIPSVIAGASSVCKCASAPGGDNCGGQPAKTGGESPTGSQPTGGNNGVPQPSGSENPTGGNGGSPAGSPQPTGGKQPSGGSGSGGNPTGEQPTRNGGRPIPATQPTTPPVVVSSAGRYEISLMVCVFGAFWAVAVAL
ncbi:hypothetical protein TOPH_08372 [Tolypocladium ophioglossoides CBS 100239]|uniref:CFEM domain-containing protein n=1 Tax=Tolypocladium ophioglossoides (strain CBS 100239) TaxID=1163406 RepID=A0A0L0MZR7_TOLOC|nr:hypothetical protein TOPH_08372 [Tolypocladium ophioglossoides CBS 100239]